MSNISFNSSSFVLFWFPGMEEKNLWISLPFCSMYIITILVGVSVLLIIWSDDRLHQPMFLLLSMLILADIVLSSGVLPKILLIFWFKLHEISFEECLVQMFFVHSFSIMGSSVLLAMAFDRFVAVCNPLRYSTILTNSMIAKTGMFVSLRGLILGFPYPFLVRRLPFCGSHVIEHCYCENMAVAKLSCAEPTINHLYGLVVIFLVVGVDVTCISVSYTMIIMAVLRLPSTEAKNKLGHTCATHMAVILVAYIPALFSFMTQRFGASLISSTQILLSTLYLIIPPMVNPMIYGIKMKEIRRKLLAWI
ncbi:hypothetical protein GDO86_019644 [Hymenochirus boettgeri]|uniref:G-protein coupled receptors family 1 profile domain-containing protein n=1 Tax=Hymenochirus boettgeri TaxID=247094 RepID=A0A8T2III1_9PIPI|nr:hypothetical protein GDO86_019644 [Hymenochirus boettgeri]